MYAAVISKKDGIEIDQSKALLVSVKADGTVMRPRKMNKRVFTLSAMASLYDNTIETIVVPQYSLGKRIDPALYEMVNAGNYPVYKFIEVNSLNNLLEVMRA